MTTTSFGRRGAAVAARPVPTTQSAAAVKMVSAGPSTADHLDWDSENNDLTALWPLATFGLIFLLAVVFALQIHFAFDIGTGREMSLESLIAFGGSSRDLVFGSHQVWRVFTAPMLHADTSHLLGNCIALGFVGYRLESLVGRGWFCLIYVVGGLGGELASLLGNSSAVVSVGASGAISGLIGGVFVMSFHGNADPETQRRMRNTALRFGVPALLPMLWNISNGVDYYAHAGGALAGALVAMVLMVHWRQPTFRPSSGEDAGTGALVGLAGVMVASVFVVMQYPALKAQAAERAPILSLVAAGDKPGNDAQTVAIKYANDPRAHFLAGAKYLGEKNVAGAEREMRQVLAMVPETGAGQDADLRAKARMMLAMTLTAQNRLGEARELASVACRKPVTQRDDFDQQLKLAFELMKLCD